MKVDSTYISPEIEDFLTIWAGLPNSSEGEDFFYWLYPAESRLVSWYMDLHLALSYTTESAKLPLPIVCCNCMISIGSKLGGGLVAQCPLCYEASSPLGKASAPWKLGALMHISHYAAPVVVVNKLLELGVIK